MIINRNNYEEFFLLYVDNELSAEERVEVEKFVEQNTDLQKEFMMFKEATISAEKIKFEGKELLFKREDSISLGNYEEYFLLSVDDELNKKQVDDVEKFVLKHPQLQEEFTLLKKVKLEPEVIEFKEKETLFRKERRVIPIGYLRMGIAAAVATIIALSWFLDQGDTVKTESSIAISKEPAKEITTKKVQQLFNKPVTEQAVATLSNKREDKQVERKVTALQSTSVSKNTLAKVDQVQEVKPLKQLKNDLPERTPATPDLAQNEEPENSPIQTITGDRKDENEISITSDKNLINAGFTDEQTPLVKHAVYREIENEEDKSFYIGSAQINKNKLKGLLKKAATLFDKKADQDEDDDKTLRIAGFRIKSK